MGCDAATAEQFRRPARIDFEIEPGGYEALKIFLAAQTQWNISTSMGGALVVGLNYQSLEFLFRIHDVKDEREIMDHLQAMELSALEVFNSEGREDGG